MSVDYMIKEKGEYSGSRLCDIFRVVRKLWWSIIWIELDFKSNGSSHANTIN